jgi:hypothetical protein
MSLSIGVHILQKLSASQELHGVVGDKIFPIAATHETTFPFIIYKRGSLTPGYTKDQYATGDNATAEVIVASDKYADSVKVIELVRSALENQGGEYDEFTVIDAKIISADEDFIEDTFVQRITFSFETETE